MNDSTLILHMLPSTGSRWIAKCLRTASGMLHGTDEFFTPHVNWNYNSLLEQYLGDSLTTNNVNYTRRMSARELDWVVQQCKWKGGFTKENYITYQLDAFNEIADIVCVTKSVYEVLPPSRRQVLRWYDAMYCSLFGCNVEMHNAMERAVIGYVNFDREMRVSCGRLQIPCLDMDALMNYAHHRLRRYLLENLASKSHVIDIDLLTDEICNSRRHIPRPLEHREQWEDALRVHGK